MSKINYISPVLTLIPIIYSLAYWIWSISHLTPAEKTLLSLKTKFNISLLYLLVGFIAFSVFLVMLLDILYSYFSTGSFDRKTMGLIFFTSSYALALFFILINSSMQKPNIYVHCQNREYTYLHKINKEFFTATLKDKENNRIQTYLIPIKSLTESSDNYLITEDKKYLSKFGLIGMSLVMGVIIACYYLACIYMFLPAHNVLWKHKLFIFLGAAFIILIFFIILYRKYPKSQLKNGN